MIPLSGSCTYGWAHLIDIVVSGCRSDRDWIVVWLRSCTHLYISSLSIRKVAHNLSLRSCNFAQAAAQSLGKTIVSRMPSDDDREHRERSRGGGRSEGRSRRSGERSQLGKLEDRLRSVEDSLNRETNYRLELAEDVKQVA